MERPEIGKHVFRVYEKVFMTPHYIRIVLEGEGTSDFAVCTLGVNNKIMVPPSGQKKVKLAVWDKGAGAWSLPEEAERPTIRTYTHRAIDTINNRITVDFVNHGDSGPASAWARAAEIGDELGVAMKLRPTVLYPTADWYLLVGDATALPVLAVILETLPATAKGHCLLEVHGEDDVHPEIYHPGFTIEWLFNANPEKQSALADRVEDIAIPEQGKSFAYVACEYRTVKRVRTYFREKLAWLTSDYYAYSYWKAGVAEDQSVLDRQAEKNG